MTHPGPERRRGDQSPVRMLHVITRLIRGGADENTLHTVAGLDPRRYVVDLAVGAGSELDRFGSIPGVTVHVIPDLVRDPHPVRDVLALCELARLVRRGGYQIVHTHTAKAGFLGRLAAAIAGTPVVIHTVHGVTFHEHLGPCGRAFYVLLERIAARFTHQFVAVGEDVRDRYLRAGIGAPAAYETIYSGMPLDEYFAAAEMPDAERAAMRAELGLAPHHRAVVMAARLEPRKGHGHLFAAVRRLVPEHPELRVLLAGDGPGRAALEARCRALGLESVVRFIGFRADLPRVLAAADVAVLTSLWEGLPRVLVQAAAAGKPIVTFDVEGAWEVVRDGRGGYVVPTRDVAAFAERLRVLLADDARARAMGRAGRDQVGRHWTVETMLERLDDLYARWTAPRGAA